MAEVGDGSLVANCGASLALAQTWMAGSGPKAPNFSPSLRRQWRSQAGLRGTEGLLSGVRVTGTGRSVGMFPDVHLFVDLWARFQMCTHLQLHT